MGRKYDKQKLKEEYVLSDLQEMILRSICVTKDADYHSLEKETKRRRTTIVQSLVPLRRHHYVWTEKANPANKTSKLIFRVTHKGFYYCIAFLSVDWDNEVIKVNIETEKQMNEYTEFIKSIPDYDARKAFLHQTAKLIMKYNPFDRKGMFVTNKIHGLLSLGVRFGILELAKGDDTLVGEKTMDQLTKMCRPEEIMEIKKFYLNLKNNLDSIIRGL
jgi:hypothetical protein